MVTISTDINQGGQMKVTYSEDALPTTVYGNDAYMIVVAVLQVIFIVGILWNMWEEVNEMIHCTKVFGTVLSYFDSAWNWLDISNLLLQVVGVAMW